MRSASPPRARGNTRRTRISQTAIGAISFLALEAIGGAITLSYGTTNAIFAIIVASIAAAADRHADQPIRHPARRRHRPADPRRGLRLYRLDHHLADLCELHLHLFAIEASIMSGALELVFGVPLWLGYIIRRRGGDPAGDAWRAADQRFQLITQPIWIVLNILPFIFIALSDWEKFDLWLRLCRHRPCVRRARHDRAVRSREFGAASAVILALMAQIGEQVDFLRFLPPDHTAAKWRHRLAHASSPAPAGSSSARRSCWRAPSSSCWRCSSGVPARMAPPIRRRCMSTAFGYMVPWHHTLALLLMAAFVVVSQLKINVMNAYAGSLAWSNFFSRLTHSHPGRVVWLFFNVAIALLLMELGIYRLLEETLGVFSIIAMAWLCTISADLFINKPLGLAPPGIEFKRAHLYDINPVGVGAHDAIAAAMALVAHFGAVRRRCRLARALHHARRGADRRRLPSPGRPRANTISPASRASSGRTCRPSPARSASIPSSPRTWPGARPMPRRSARSAARSTAAATISASRNARLNAQVGAVAKAILPETVRREADDAPRPLWHRRRAGADADRRDPGDDRRSGRARALAGDGRGRRRAPSGSSSSSSRSSPASPAGSSCWPMTAGVVAEEESSRQNTLLLKEIAAHKKTDAALQNAKETAEAANRAKSRYVVGLSHELRTPLNAVLGYAQILERDETIPAPRQSAIKVIRRSAEHLSGLIDGLLDISKIEAGRLQVYSNEINIQRFPRPDRRHVPAAGRGQGAGLQHVSVDAGAAAISCAPTRSGCGRSSSTCSPTPSNITDEGTVIASKSPIAARSRHSPSLTPARAFRRDDLPRHLRALPARHRRAGQARARPRPRPDHHPAADPDAGRRDHGRKRAGRRLDLQGAADALRPSMQAAARRRPDRKIVEL